MCKSKKKTKKYVQNVKNTIDNKWNMGYCIFTKAQMNFAYAQTTYDKEGGEGVYDGAKM